VNIVEKNNVKILGQGNKTLIFAHGYGCDQNMWKRLIPFFEKDHQIILFDHVGAGNSDSSAYDRAKYSTLHGYAEDVVRLCRDLDVEQGTFVGHSVSAMIGILAAIKAPQYFSNLVLVSPNPCFVNDGEYTGGFERQALIEILTSLESNYAEWSKVMAPVIMGNNNDPELGHELAASFCRARPDIAKQFAQVTFLSDCRPDLPKLQVPSLILQCANDAIAPESVGHYLRKTLKGSEMVQMKNEGHCPHVSAPDETAHAIRGYLAASTKAA